jgi:methyl-accepting chemotaxis protein
MKLKTQILLLPVSVALIFLVSVGAVMLQAMQALADIRGLRTIDYPSATISSGFTVQVDDLVASIQAAVAEGSKERLAEATDKTKRSSEQLSRLAAIEGREAEAVAMSAKLSHYADTAKSAAKLMLGIEEGDPSDAIAKMQRAHQDLSTATRAQQEQAERRLDEAVRGVDAGVRGTLLTIMAASSLVCAVLALGSYLLYRAIWAKIGGEPEAVQDLLHRAAQGDLSGQLPIKEGDSSSVLASVAQMMDGLEQMIRAIRSSAESMTEASDEIADGNQNLRWRTEQATAHLSQTSRAMQSLSHAIRSWTGAALTASELARTAARVAEQGNEIVGGVVRTMDEIEASSKKIADINKTIDSIAFQTNILALNAAVEAARAGEHGRGFAVVAAEVRVLANRSAQAATQIKSLINESVQRVQNGAILVSEAGGTMNEMVSSAQRVTQIIEEITTGSGSQVQDIDSVNHAVGELEDMTRMNASLVQQSATAATDLKGDAARLAEVARQFVLREAVAA